MNAKCNTCLFVLINLLFFGLIALICNGCGTVRTGKAGNGEVSSKIQANGVYISEIHGSVKEKEDAVRITIEIVVQNSTTNIQGKMFPVELPPEAAVDRFGMWVMGNYMEGEILERKQAQRVFDRYVRKKVDPALLVKSASGKCSVNIFPVLPQSTAKVLISYVISRGTDQTLTIPYPPVPQKDIPWAKVLPCKSEFLPVIDEPVLPSTIVRSFQGEPGKPGYFSADIVMPRIKNIRTFRPDIVLVLRDISFSMNNRAFSLPDYSFAEDEGIPWYQIDFDIEAFPARSVRPGEIVTEPNAASGRATDLGAAFKAASEFLKTQDFNKAFVILLSDGADTCGNPDQTEWKKDMASAGPGKIAMSCFPVNPRLTKGMGLVNINPGSYSNIKAIPGSGCSDIGQVFYPDCAEGKILRVFGRCSSKKGDVHLSYTLPDLSKGRIQIPLEFTPENSHTHLPQLWAQARISDLEFESSFAESKAKKSALLSGSRKLALAYNLLSTQTSFLVLES